VGSIGLIAICLSCFVGGALCGLISMIILEKVEIGRLVAFGWGAALGPAGLVVAAVVAYRAAERAKLAQNPVFEW